MIEGMYSALDINLGVFLHYVRRIGLSSQLLSEKLAFKGLWDSFMQRPQSLEVCQAGMTNKETGVHAEVTGSLRNILSDNGWSQEDGEEVVQEEENSIQTKETKERKKLRRKKQHEERSWYSLW